MKKYKLGIVGATGAVGQEIIKLLEKRAFPASEIRLLASARSAGNQMDALGQTLTISETTPDSFKDLDFAIFSAGSENSVAFAHEAVKRNCIVIDNSSAFRMDPSVPLVVPEINPEELDNHQGIMYPNCSSAIALMSIYPLQKIWTQEILCINLPGGLRSWRNGAYFTGPGSYRGCHRHTSA